MEENREENPTENTEEAAASGGENTEGEGLLVGAARVVGSALGKVAAAIGGGETEAQVGGPKRRRQEKVGLVTSDKMTKTVVVRVERQVKHPKYKRYIRKRSKFMAHDEIGARIGDIVRIIETRPLSARKRWRVIEIVQKAS
ncbi:MAG TPA: 30S ribosomal protein S17 [Blastocatellia bacterium]|nr:30S ribosomal protein S17 [Blastocatellia bacterium]